LRLKFETASDWIGLKTIDRVVEYAGFLQVCEASIPTERHKNCLCQSAGAFVPAYRGGNDTAVNMDCSIMHQI